MDPFQVLFATLTKEQKALYYQLGLQYGQSSILANPYPAQYPDQQQQLVPALSYQQQFLITVPLPASTQVNANMIDPLLMITTDKPLRLSHQPLKLVQPSLSSSFYKGSVVHLSSKSTDLFATPLLSNSPPHLPTKPKEPKK